MGKKIALFLGLLFPMMVHAADPTAAAFSSYVLDGRISAMGSAGTVIASDSTAVVWNPAFLATKTGADVTLMQAKAFETQHLGAFLVFNHLGFGISHSGVDGITDTTTGGSHTFSGDVVYVAGALSISPEWSVGVTGKYTQQSISTNNSHGMGVDVGMVYTPFSWLTIAGVVQNFMKTPYTSSTGTKESFPVVLRGGFSSDLFSKSLILAVEVDKSEDRDATLHCGLSYSPLSVAVFRAGIDNGSLTLGVGLCLDTIRIDCSWEAAQQSFLEDPYRFSVGMRF